ncbi:MAG: acyl-CoA desaturase, partial [Planctomycetes bacterium]|nr:acyl-CoA desaturase [Planctomycetota bacterium]
YSLKNTARDSILTALLTFGEGYHNFHHRFQSDYRNGIRWYHFDPSKWTIWSLSRVGLVSDLKRASKDAIQRAKDSVQREKKEKKLARRKLATK